MAALPNIPQSVVLANQAALDHCKELQSTTSFHWFVGILSEKRDATIRALALPPTQTDKLTEGQVFALRGQLALLLELADGDSCPMLDEIKASAKLLQAPEYPCNPPESAQSKRVPAP
jgi:hypothetical protein